MPRRITIAAAGPADRSAPRVSRLPRVSLPDHASFTCGACGSPPDHFNEHCPHPRAELHCGDCGYGPDEIGCRAALEVA